MRRNPPSYQVRVIVKTVRVFKILEVSVVVAVAVDLPVRKKAEFRDRDPLVTQNPTTTRAGM